VSICAQNVIIILLSFIIFNALCYVDGKGENKIAFYLISPKVSWYFCIIVYLFLLILLFIHIFVIPVVLRTTE
jgi:hypothetical protein